MSKSFDTMEDSNHSSNPSIHDVSSPERRTFLRGGSAAVVALLAPLAGCGSMGAAMSGPMLGFKGIPPAWVTHWWCRRATWPPHLHCGANR